MELQKTIQRVEIVSERGHYIAYVNGEFYCPGDTYFEVVRELTEDGLFK